MKFIRPIDWNDPSVINLPGDYKGLILHWTESCVLIATLIPPGIEGPARHRHPTSDQVYFVVEGEVTIELGQEVKTAGKNSVVYIPAGTPHHNWNPGDTTEVHLEVIAPQPSPAMPLAEFVDTKEGGNGRGYVRTADEAILAGDPPYPGMDMTFEWLVSREIGPEHASIYLAEVRPNSRGPHLHVHDFDQFYFVLEGSMAVQIGAKEYEAGPNTLVVLPAGVPHRQWNPGSEPERHIAILAPEPAVADSDDDPWDMPVKFERLSRVENPTH